MDDLREKVVYSIERCISHVPDACRDCAYDAGHPYNECVEMMLKDALSLLKAQESRVITLADLWHMEHKPVFLQRKNSRLYMVEPAIVLKTEWCYIPSLGDSYILMRENKIHDKYWACGYNVTWRCWTSRPTDEQREAVKWE